MYEANLKFGLPIISLLRLEIAAHEFGVTRSPAETLRRVLRLAGVAGFAACMHANNIDAQALSEDDFLSDVPVIISASRLTQPTAEAPSATTIIDREMIRASGFREIADLLRLAPGFYVAHANGNQPVVSYHGFTGEFSPRLQVLLDGRSIYLPIFGSVEWADLPIAIDDIERIEVVRGPNAASYGANAFSGAINIMTRHPSTQKGAYAEANVGNHDIRDGTFRYSSNIANTAYRATLGYRNDDGFKQRVDDMTSRFLNIRGDTQLSLTDDLDFQLGALNSRRERGFEGCPQLVDCPRAQHIDAFFTQLRWKRAVSATEEVMAHFNYDFRNVGETGFSGPVPQFTAPPRVFNISNPITIRRYEAEVQHTFAPREGWRVVWGTGARIDQATAPLLFGRNDAIDSKVFRIFGHGEYRPGPHWLFSGGAMVEKNNIVGSTFSPRVAVNFVPWENHTLRASFSSATRTPTLYEQFSNLHFDLGAIQLQPTQSSGGLDAERIRSAELGYLGQFLEQRLNVDFRVYSERLSQLVETFQRPFPGAINRITVDFANVNRARVHGIETQVDFRPNRETRLVFNYGRTLVSSNDPRLEKLSPENMISALLIRQLPWQFSASAGYYQYSARNVSSLQPFGPPTSIPLSRRLDLRLSKGFRLGSVEGDVSLVFQNLLTPYQDFRSENLYDKRVWTNLQVKF